MSLVELWHRSRAEVAEKRLHQVIAFAGSGKLKDKDQTSQEFRDFLSAIPSEMLAAYADECLRAPFADSGLALQDVVNEVGRRLGFNVTHGMYRGRAGAVGFDGLWQMPLGHVILIEVKTTDAFRIDLETIAGYRRALVGSGSLSMQASSILLIVGRQDTGDLEAQVRGSRHAWEVRLISVDALLRLMRVKEAVDEPETVSRIHAILTPREFTRLDAIVDVVFSAASEAKQEEAEVEALGAGAEDVPEGGGGAILFSKSLQDVVIARVERAYGHTLVRRSRSSFSTPDERFRICYSLGRRHDLDGGQTYSHVLNSYQVSYLREAEIALAVFVCGAEEQAIALPLADLEKWVLGTPAIERDERTFWSIVLARDRGGVWTLRPRDGGSSGVISNWVLP